MAIVVFTPARLSSFVGDPSTDELSAQEITDSFSDALDEVSRFKPQQTYDVTIETVKDQQAYSPPSGVSVSQNTGIYVYGGGISSVSSKTALTGGYGDSESAAAVAYDTAVLKKRRGRELDRLVRYEWDLDTANNKFLLIPPPCESGRAVRVEYSGSWSSTTEMGPSEIYLYNTAASVCALFRLIAKSDIAKIEEGAQRIPLQNLATYKYLYETQVGKFSNLTSGGVMAFAG